MFMLQSPFMDSGSARLHRQASRSSSFSRFSPRIAEPTVAHSDGSTKIGSFEQGLRSGKDQVPMAPIGRRVNRIILGVRFRSPPPGRSRDLRQAILEPAGLAMNNPISSRSLANLKFARKAPEERMVYFEFLLVQNILSKKLSYCSGQETWSHARPISRTTR